MKRQFIRQTDLIGLTGMLTTVPTKTALIFSKISAAIIMKLKFKDYTTFFIAVIAARNCAPTTSME